MSGGTCLQSQHSRGKMWFSVCFGLRPTRFDLNSSLVCCSQSRGTVGGKTALDVPFQTLAGPLRPQDKNSLSSTQVTLSEKDSFLVLCLSDLQLLRAGKAVFCPDQSMCVEMECTKWGHY